MAFSALLIAGCGDATGPELEGLRHSVVSSVELVPCPSEVTRSGTQVIGPLGGTLTVDGHLVQFPAGAVRTATSFTMEVPASPYLEVRVTAEGHAHYQFEVPVALSLMYARCDVGSLDHRRLQVLYIEDGTRAVRANKGGADSRTGRRITTLTDHFSSYALGAN